MLLLTLLLSVELPLLDVPNDDQRGVISNGLTFGDALADLGTAEADWRHFDQIERRFAPRTGAAAPC